MSPHQSRRRAASRGGLEPLESRVLPSTRLTPPTTWGVGGFASHGLIARGHAVVSHDIVYEDVSGRQERLDVYEPGGTAPAGGWPVLLAIHGGGWRKFDKSGYGPEVAAQFNPHGYVVVAMNYTLSRPGAPSWPANLEDVRAAASWVHGHAVEFGIDPNRMAAIGESAGGQLAEMLGMDSAAPASPGGQSTGGDTSGASSSGISAVTSFYGPTDLSALVSESVVGGLAAEQLLGGTPAQFPASYVAASPVDHVSTDAPPMLLLDGTADTIVPIAQAEELASALTAAGVPNQLVAVEDAHHGFEFQPRGRDLVPQMLAFLEASWKDKGSIFS